MPEFMKPQNVSHIAFFLFGFVLLALGIGGSVSLGMILKDWLPARGVVERIESERVYRYRKMRWKHRIGVRYETARFGEMYVLKEVYLTLGLRKGSEVALLYNPGYVREVRFPVREGWLYGLSGAAGLGLIGIGNVLRKERRKAGEGVG